VPAKPGRGVQPKPPSASEGRGGSRKRKRRASEKRAEALARPSGRRAAGGKAHATPSERSKRGAPWYAPEGRAAGEGRAYPVLAEQALGRREGEAPDRLSEAKREACGAGCPALARGGYRAEGVGGGAGEPPEAGA